MVRTFKLAGFGIALLVAGFIGAVTLQPASAQITVVTEVNDMLPVGWTPPPPPWAQDGDEAAAAPEESEATDGAVDLGAIEPISCDLVEGCSVPVAITVDGAEVVKLMVITFEDLPAEAEETPAAE